MQHVVPTMLQDVALKCCERLARPLHSYNPVTLLQKSIMSMSVIEEGAFESGSEYCSETDDFQIGHKSGEDFSESGANF